MLKNRLQVVLSPPYSFVTGLQWKSSSKKIPIVVGWLVGMEDMF
jgi:hypothetical protein